MNKLFKINVAYSISGRNFLRSFTACADSWAEACAVVFGTEAELRATTTTINSIR